MWHYFYVGVVAKRAAILGSAVANMPKRNVDQAVGALIVTTDYLKLKVSILALFPGSPIRKQSEKRGKPRTF